MTVSSASEALAALASLRDRRMSPRERAEVIESVAAWIVAREAHVRESLEAAVRMVRDAGLSMHGKSMEKDGGRC